MDVVIKALKGTPWWVYAMFVFFVYRAIQALKPQVLSIKKIFILPLVFFIWAVYSLIKNYHDFGDLAIWLFCLIVGGLIGWNLAQGIRIKADKKKLLMRVPGNSLILVLILFIFAVKYFIGYYCATHPQAHENSLIHFTSLVISSLITGVFLGRISMLMKKFAKAEHTKLKEET